MEAILAKSAKLREIHVKIEGSTDERQSHYEPNMFLKPCAADCC